MPMKRFIKITIAFLSALILGVGSALASILAITKMSMIRNGPWETNLAVGSESSGIYVRAMVAAAALFALNKNESIYYNAETDSGGHNLRSTCDYRIDGEDIDTRWWSITLYGPDQFLVANEQQRYSFNKNNVAHNPDGSFTIYISQNKKKGNWIPSGDESRLYLMLRLYNPAPAVYNNPGGISLPSITREGCR